MGFWHVAARGCMEGKQIGVLQTCKREREDGLCVTSWSWRSGALACAGAGIAVAVDRLFGSWCDWERWMELERAGAAGEMEMEDIHGYGIWVWRGRGRGAWEMSAQARRRYER